MPQPEMHDLINELRSITQVAGTSDWKSNHLQALAGKEGEHEVAQRVEAMKQAFGLSETLFQRRGEP